MAGEYKGGLTPRQHVALMAREIRGKSWAMNIIDEAVAQAKLPIVLKYDPTHHLPWTIERRGFVCGRYLLMATARREYLWWREATKREKALGIL